MQAVHRWLTKRASMHPQRTALYVPDGAGEYVPMTYRELERRVHRLAAALSAAGLARGDRLAVLSLNSPQFVETLFAAAHLGLIVVPLNIRLSLREWRPQLNDSGAPVLLPGTESQRPAAHPVA